MFRRRLHTGIVAVGATVASALLGAQQAPVAPDAAPLSSRMPVDPQVLTGEFENGLRYYVRRNGRPQNRAELRLVVNAGSVLEDDDQRGLAHFVEHMAFNGTKNFPKLEIVSFMESIGMRFGPSVNAFTSFDETVYMLQVPTENAEVLDRALLVLEDWAQNVTFEPAEIDKERGVIIEEWRSRRGASARLQDRQIPVLLENSKYANRLPIGTTDILQNFTHDRLTQFYKDWYRPDLMAVIAVGDFDPAVVEARIRARFAPIPKATTARPRAPHTVPQRSAPAFVIATDRPVSMACSLPSNCSVRSRSSRNSRFSASTSTAASAPSTALGTVIPNKTKAEIFLINNSSKLLIEPCVRTRARVDRKGRSRLRLEGNGSQTLHEFATADYT